MLKLGFFLINGSPSLICVLLYEIKNMRSKFGSMFFQFLTEHEYYLDIFSSNQYMLTGLRYLYTPRCLS